VDNRLFGNDIFISIHPQLTARCRITEVKTDDEALGLARQFNTRLASGLSSEKVGTSISKRSPLSVTIW